MKWIRRHLNRLGGFLKDIFYGQDNLHAEASRIFAFLALTAEMIAAFWNMHLKKEIDLGPNGLGGGLTAILGASAAFLAAKAWSQKKVRESSAIAQNTAVAVAAGTPVAPTQSPDDAKGATQ